MCIVSKEHNFIFVRAEKNASQALNKYFTTFSNANDLVDTIPIDQQHNRWAQALILKHGQDFWDNAYKFAFVRNPWKRTASWFLYDKDSMYHKFMDDKIVPNKKIKDLNEGLPYIQEQFKEWLLEFSSETNKNLSKDFCWGPSKGGRGLPLSQMEFLMNLKGEIDYDFIGKVENIKEDVKYLIDGPLSSLGTPTESLRHSNKNPWAKHGKFYPRERSKKENVRPSIWNNKFIYTPTTYLMVRTFLKKEIDFFGYEYKI